MGAAATGTDDINSVMNILTSSMGKLANGWRAGYLVCFSCVLGKWADSPIWITYSQQAADAFN